jgi:hypothetical protein
MQRFSSSALANLFFINEVTLFPLNNITYKGREGKTKSQKFLGDITGVSGRCSISQFLRYISSGGGVARGIPPFQPAFSSLTNI